MTSDGSVVGVYGTLDEAEAAVKRLSDEGFPIGNVSIVARDLTPERSIRGFVSVGDVAKAGCRLWRLVWRHQREVLTTSIEEATVAGIAQRLFLSEGTVRNHLSAAIQKLGARNRAEAVRLAEQKGWLEPGVEA